MGPESVTPSLPGHDIPWLVRARQSAFARFAAHGFPTRREEEWKYTDVSAIARRTSLSPDVVPHAPPAEAVRYAEDLAREGSHLLVFVDGLYSAELSAPGELPPSVRLTGLAEALGNADGLPEGYFDKAHEHTIFAALNTAYATGGAVLQLEAGTTLAGPVNLLFVTTAAAAAIYPRNLIMLGAGARATVVEHHVGAQGSKSFTDVVTQVSLAPGAELRHCKLMAGGDAEQHVAGIHAEQAEGSRFTSYSFVLGGRLVRNDITSRLAEPGCSCTFDGLYLLDDRQHVDHHTRIDHLAPSCTSREHYRGILDGESHGVFNGKVIVHPHAAKSDAHQSNHNLLLSRQAEADTKPQLEIFADDVKCTHGATVGQLDDESMFYLRSRGVDAESARSLLIYGFANDIIGRVGVPELRARIERMMLQRLPQGEQIKELL